MITKAVRRRSTGKHSKFPIGRTPQEDIRSAMPPDKSTVQGVPRRGSRAFGVLSADLELPWECVGIVVWDRLPLCRAPSGRQVGRPDLLYTSF
jgi:hypothetical protein